MAHGELTLTEARALRRLRSSRPSVSAARRLLPTTNRTLPTISCFSITRAVRDAFGIRTRWRYFRRLSGDAVLSHSTLSLGGSVQDACEGIVKDWSEHAAQIKAAAAKPTPSAAPTPAVVEVAAKSVAAPKISVASTPDGADIEIDGSFVGNTPSVVELTPGEHVVVVKKSGYRTVAEEIEGHGRRDQT